jgi:hypothetical protein
MDDPRLLHDAGIADRSRESDLTFATTPTATHDAMANPLETYIC